MARILTEETSLTRRRRSLAAENGLLRRLLPWEIGLAALLVLAGLVRVAVRHRYDGLIAGIALAALPYGHWQKVHQNAREGDALASGIQGEASTARRLDGLLDNTHYLFNDVVLRHSYRSAQIDHLVVCRRGVFVIETKNWRGAVSGRGDDAFWTQVKRPGEAPIRLKSPVLQVRRQAEVVARVLAAAGLKWPDVVPAVAFASAMTEVRIEAPGIPVVHLDHLAAAFAAHPASRAYSEEEVDRAVAVILKRMAA